MFKIYRLFSYAIRMDGNVSLSVHHIGLKNYWTV